ncbi:MAG: M48 family peptidase [Rhodocyclaceae bacterium]|nr:M48 family peptidase [Rhodocyclaceae bacterium]
MHPQPPPNYLAGYPPALVAQVREMIDTGQLAGLLLKKYPTANDVRTDKALYAYVQDLKDAHLRNVGQLSKVAFDNKLHVIRNALGTHTSISRVQGAKLKTKREIRIAAIFKDMPEAFLRMIVVHELAHMKERDHDKAFYQLCQHMEPEYHQLEFDLRAYLSYLDAAGEALWQGTSPEQRWINTAVASAASREPEPRS